jgi:hypothetical protein
VITRIFSTMKPRVAVIRGQREGVAGVGLCNVYAEWLVCDAKGRKKTKKTTKTKTQGNTKKLQHFLGGIDIINKHESPLTKTIPALVLKVKLQYSVQQRRAEGREVIPIVKAKLLRSRRLLHLMRYA